MRDIDSETSKERLKNTVGYRSGESSLSDNSREEICVQIATEGSLEKKQVTQGGVSRLRL